MTEFKLSNKIEEADEDTIEEYGLTKYEYDIVKCPLCNNKLVEKAQGLVCKNWKCKLYWKLGSGWIYMLSKEEVKIQDYIKKQQNDNKK